MRIPTARPFAALLVTTDHGTRGGTGRDTAMKHRRWVLAGVGVLALGALAFAGASVWAMNCGGCEGEAVAAAGHDHLHSGATTPAAAPAAHEGHEGHQVGAAHASPAADLKAAIAAVDAAAKAVESGDKAAATMYLARAKTLLASFEAAMDKAAGTPTGGFANTKCPIMGSPIDPAKVTPDLVRVYNGKKIGFCCAGCPARWDKLTDAEKEVKLR